MDTYAKWFDVIVVGGVLLVIFMQGLGVFSHAITKKGREGTSEHPNQKPASFATFVGEIILIGVILIISYNKGVDIVNAVLSGVWSIWDSATAPSAVIGIVS
jgi:hypothetical protein